jgi:hypothetical protein
MQTRDVISDKQNASADIIVVDQRISPKVSCRSFSSRMRRSDLLPNSWRSNQATRYFSSSTDCFSSSWECSSEAITAVFIGAACDS